VLIVTTDASRSGLNADTLRVMYRDTVARLSAIAGVRSASVSQVTPIWGGGTERSVFVQPIGSVERRETRSVYMNWVSPGYFARMGTPIYSGRDFTWRDPPTSANVAIINRAMARQYFGTETPLGARIESHDETFEIGAVVGNAKYLDVREAIQPTVYSVARRTNEIGIRMALGAQAVQIAGMVVREALLLTRSGAVGGPKWKRFPIGSSPGHARCAIDIEITATWRSRSASLKKRPACSDIPMVRK
jgi:hypothetical protein